jgi:hypothetical protein
MVRLLAALAALTSFVLLVGPWPLPRTPVDETPEGRAALLGARGLGASGAGEPGAAPPAAPATGPGATSGAPAGPSPERSPAPLRAGLGRREMRVPIGPGKGVLLAGYGIRAGIRPMPALEVADPCHARALALETPAGPALLVAADILYIGAETRRRLLAALAADPGIPASRVMLTATHSHAAPGEFAGGPAETIAVGAFREEVVAAVVLALAGAARDAVRDLAPAELDVARTSVPSLVRNRYWRADEAAHGIVVDADLTVLRVRAPREGAGGDASAPGRLRGVFAVYGAHATVLGPWRARLSGDWPGAFSAAVERGTPGAVALVAAGSVGSQAPDPPEVPAIAGEDEDDRDLRRARAMGESLARTALELPLEAAAPAAASLETRDLPYPAPLFRLAPDWRASPLFVAWLYPTPREAPFSALRLGRDVFLGVPAEISGEVSLAMKAAAARAAPGVRLTATSFAGHYHGYVPPDRCYERFRYENRLSIHGARHGAFLEAIAAAAVSPAR